MSYGQKIHELLRNVVRWKLNWIRWRNKSRTVQSNESIRTKDIVLHKGIIAVTNLLTVLYKSQEQFKRCGSLMKPANLSNAPWRRQTSAGWRTFCSFQDVDENKVHRLYHRTEMLHSTNSFTGLSAGSWHPPSTTKLKMFFDDQEKLRLKFTTGREMKIKHDTSPKY